MRGNGMRRGNTSFFSNECLFVEAITTCYLGGFFMAKIMHCALAIVLSTLFVTAASAAKLADSEYKKMLQGCPEFAVAEKHMDAAWKALGQVADAKNMKEYMAWQKNWVDQERQASVAAMLTTKKDKAIIPKGASKDSQVHKDLAYAVVTEERALWLDELVRQEKDANYLPEFTGRLSWGRNPVGSYLAFTPDGWWTSLLLCYAMSIDDIPSAAHAKEVLESSSEGVVPVAVKGRLTSELGFEWYGDTPGIENFRVTVDGQSGSDKAGGAEKASVNAPGQLMLVNITDNGVKVQSAPNAESDILFQVNEDKDFLVVDKTPVKDESGQEWYSVAFAYVYLGKDSESGDEDTFQSVDGTAYIKREFVKKHPDSEEIIESRNLEYFYGEKIK